MLSLLFASFGQLVARVVGTGGLNSRVRCSCGAVFAFALAFAFRRKGFFLGGLGYEGTVNIWIGDAIMDRICTLLEAL